MPLFSIGSPSVLSTPRLDINRFFEVLGAELRSAEGWSVTVKEDRLEFAEIAVPYGRQPVYLSDGVVFVESGSEETSIGFEARLSWLNLALPYLGAAIGTLVVIWGRFELGRLLFIGFMLTIPWLHLISVRGAATEWLTGRIRETALSVAHDTVDDLKSSGEDPMHPRDLVERSLERPW
jgi:hypothetical protein